LITMAALGIVAVVLFVYIIQNPSTYRQASARLTVVAALLRKNEAALSSLAPTNLQSRIEQVGQNSDVRINREWGERPLIGQLMTRASDLATVYSAPRKLIGAALWCGIDHQRGYHPDPFRGGLLDLYRIPRYAWPLTTFFSSQANFNLRHPQPRFNIGV